MKFTTLSRKISIFIAIITSFIIISCGGGSGGVGGGGTPAPAPITENFVVISELAELDEVAKTIQYTLNLSTALDSRVTVSYEATNDTAQSGQDFTATKGTATIEIGQTSTTFSVPILDDNVVEQTEQFSIVLSNLKVYRRENGAFILDNNLTLQLPTAKLAPVKIRDNDSAELSVSYKPTNGEIREGEVLVVSVTSTNPIEVKDGLKLNYTGVPSSEFIISGDRIASGASSTDLRLLARADGITEGIETFEFNLVAINNQVVFGRDDVLIISRGRSKNITVTDRLTVGFIAPVKQEILENGGGMLTFKVGILSDTNATHSSAINLNATTSLTGGSAGEGDLKTLTGKTATIAVGETSADLKIAITDLVVDDNLVELRENFFIELTKGANFPDALAISTEQNRVEVEILNDDTADIGFAANYPDIREGATGTLRVSTTNNVEGDLGLRYTVSGTAQAGVDYEELSGITNNGDIVIKTKLDSEVESPETIGLTLSGVSSEYKIGASNTNALSISATNANTQVRITDTPIVSIVANQTINEATPMLQIITSATIDSEITVNLSIESGTAIAGKDFVANTVIKATIPANATANEIDLSDVIATSDNIVELDETISVVITKRGNSDEFAVNPDSAKNRVAVTLRSEDRATLDIIASDRKLDIGEGQNANIVVASSNPIDIGEDLVINYSDEAIRATRNADYSFNSATITIPRGATSGTLVLESKFDSEKEATEGVRLQITAIQNTILQNNLYTNYISIADASVSTITIRDRNTLRLVVANGFITEQADSVAITLELDRAVTDSTTEVAYEVTTDTAKALLDFDAISGTVTIPAGVKTGTFEIAIKDDEIVEKPETF